jgi:nitrogen fixation/metabolism regulation signal transduction histidine kinase
VAALHSFRDVERLFADEDRASRLAHEVNNPLTYVTANLELLARKLAGSAGAGRPGPADRAGWDEMRELVAESREGVERIRRAVRAFQAAERGILPSGAGAPGPVAG